MINSAVNLVKIFKMNRLGMDCKNTFKNEYVHITLVNSAGGLNDYIKRKKKKHYWNTTSIFLHSQRH